MTTKYIKVKDTEGYEVEARIVYRPFDEGKPFVDITYVRDDIRGLKPALDSNTLRQLAEELDAAVEEDKRASMKIVLPRTSNYYTPKTLEIEEHGSGPEEKCVVISLNSLSGYHQVAIGHSELQGVIEGLQKLKKVLDAEV